MGGRLPIVGVMGSGLEPHEEKSQAVGRWLAGLGVHLLTGGGGGVMSSVSRAFHESPGRSGLVVGVLPGGRPADESYPNPWVELPLRTHLPLSGDQGMDSMSRNHINVLSSDVVIALPGGAGTSSEVRLAVAYARPVVAYLDSPDQIPDLPSEAQVFGHLEDVQSFVLTQLERRRRAAG